VITQSAIADASLRAETDEELVAAVLRGNVAQFEGLVRRHNRRIYRAVRAVLRDEDDVEDVMQQAYLNAYKHLQQFTGNAQFSTWLTRIAVNEALARRRKHGHAFDEGGDSAMLSLVDSSTPDPEQQAVTSQLGKFMEEEVAALPDTFRLVFMLREVEGLSTSETASTLDVSEDLVKTRLHRARLMLRDRLYRRAGVTLDSVFQFGDARCDRVTSFVMTAITSS
jgi:RNA polymerase sigma-70 factor (ECF subfamily)